MATYKDFLTKENITDLSVLDEDTRQAIKDYENIAKSKIPTIWNKETGTYTPNAAAKLKMLDKTIKNGVTEYLITRDEADELAAAEETKRQSELQAQENQRLAQLEADELAAKRGQGKKGLFGVFGM